MKKAASASYTIPEGTSTPEVTTTVISSGILEEITASVPIPGTTTVPESTSTTPTTTLPLYRVYDIITADDLATFQITGSEAEPWQIYKHLPRSIAINNSGTAEEHTIEVRSYGIMDYDPETMIAVQYDNTDAYYIARNTAE